MLEHVVIIVLVILAALYVLRGLRRSALGKTACSQDHCSSCPYGGACDHQEAEPCAGRDTNDETESAP